MQNLSSVCRLIRICGLLTATFLLFSITASAQLTWDSNTVLTGPQNNDGSSPLNTLQWNTTNTNWWSGTANVSWVNSISAIAQFGTNLNTPALSNPISVTENITLSELRLLAVTTGTIATGQQFVLQGSVAGITLDFGSNGLIQMDDRSSGGSQFASLGTNLRLKGDNLRVQKYGPSTSFQYLTFAMTQNPELTGPLTVGGSIYLTLAGPNTLQNVSRIVVEAGGSVVLSGTNPTYNQLFHLAGYGNSLAFASTSYGAIRFVANNTIVSGGILLTADAGVHTNFGGANGTTGILINSAITDGGNNFGFTRFAFTRGDGTLTLAAANTYGGATTLGRALGGYSGGITILDFTAATSPQNDILYNGLVAPGNLNFIGGNSVSVLRLVGKDGQTHSQRFNNVTVNGTHSSLELLPGVGGTINVTLGTITRTDANGTLSIVAPSSGTVTTTQAAGFVGPWLTYTAPNGSRSWALSAEGLMTSGYAGTLIYTTGSSLSTAPFSATSHVGIDSTSTGALTLGAGTTNLTTLSMADLTAARQISLGTGQTLRLGTAGGIQIVNGARALTLGVSGQTSTLSAGGAVTNTVGSLFLTNNSSVELLTINSNLANNGSSAVTLVINGAPTSRTVLTGTNAHSGGTQISSGILEVRSNGALGTSGTVTVVDGATLALSGNITISRALAAIGGFGDGNNGAIRSLSGDNIISGAIGQNAMFMIAADAGASLTIQSTSVMTYSSAITFGGAGTVTVNAVLSGTATVTKIGTGTLVLGGVNTLTGAITVNAGTLKLASTAAGGATTGFAVSAGATVDLNGQTSDRSYSLNGTGAGGFGALINSSGTTATVTGTVAMATSTQIGGPGNITISNATGLTGNVLLTKTGSGTLTVIDSTTTSARTGTTQIDAGTLRIQAATAIAPIGTGSYALNGGTLSLGFDVANTMTNVVNVISSSTIIADRASAGAGSFVETLSTLTIGTSTLTVKPGDNVTSGTMGLTLGTVSIGGVSMKPGNPTFDVQSSANAAMTLTLGALSDQAIGPRTITFQNSGSAASNITLGAATSSLVDGTVVNVAGTGGAVTLTLSSATSIGALAQVMVATGNTLVIGTAQTFGSLTGGGTITGAVTLTVGNIANNTVFDTVFSGVLGSGMALTKAGRSTLTLSGGNLYTAATTISLGTLKLGSASALGATSGVTISAGGTVDLNGQTTDRSFTSISGGGFNNAGALINSSTTTGTITGSVVLAAVSAMGGSGNITINNTGGLTGNTLLTKFGSGTLTIVSTATSARTGLNQIDAGTLRLQAATAIALAPVGTGAFVLNGGTLSLGFDVTNAMTNVVNVLSSSTIIADRSTAGAGGIVQTLGALAIGGSTLTLKAGDNVTSGTIGLTLGAVTIGGAQLLPGNPTFDVQSTTNAALTLTLGSFTDQAIGPRTITFQNSGAAASTVILGVLAPSLVDGTVVNINSGTNAGVTVSMNVVGALGGLSQVNVYGNSTLTTGITSVVLGALGGTGTVNASGAFTLVVGNAANATLLNSNFSGVLANGTGTLALTKAGLGTLTLSGSTSNTYTGATIVTAGTLVLGKTGGATAVTTVMTIGSTAASTTGNATVRLEADNQMAYALAGLNDFLTINAGGTLDMNGHTLTVNSFAGFGSTITGTGTLAMNRTGGTITFGGLNTISSTLQITTAGSGGSVTRSVSTPAVTDQLTISGAITQATGFSGFINKTLLGTLTLSGDNSYTGVTTVTGGILNIRSANALGATGASSNSVVNLGATLQIQGGITTAEEALTLSSTAGSSNTGFAGASGVNIQTGALVNVSGINNFAGLLTLSVGGSTISSDSGTLNLTHAGSITGAFNLTLAGAGDGSISSIIATTTGSLVKNGTGTWTLKGANTSTGGIVINAGTLKLGDGTSGSWSNALGLSFTGSGIFEYGGNTVSPTQGFGALTLTSGSGTLQVDAPSSGTNAVTFASLATPAAGSALNIVSPPSTSVTITGTTNTNGIVNPRLYYNGADFAASTAGVISAAVTTVATGSLTADNTTPYLISGSFAQTSSITANAGLKFSASDTLTISNGILLTINNGANTAGGILIAGAVSAVIADGGGATGLTTGGSGDLVIRTDATGDSLDIQAPITSTTTGGLTKNGFGVLTLSAANSYTGTTSINAGTLILGNAAALSTSSALVQVGGMLNLNGMTITNTATLNGTGISSAGALINNSGTTASIGALTIGLGNGTGGIGASIGGSGNIVSTGTLVGDNILVKVGAGTLTIGDNAGTPLASTRNAATRIDAGTLRISNSTSALGVATSAIILNGGTLSLGSSASVVAYPVSVTAGSTIISDVFTAGAGLTHTLGALTIGAYTLTIQGGGNVTTASTNAGVTFGAVTLIDNPTFDVKSPTTATTGTTTLTLGALSDQGVAKTVTFTNTGSATTNSVVTLGTAMASLVDGTVVTLNSGTNAGVTLNLNAALALGTLAQLNVNGSSVLSLGAAATIGSLSGDGNVIGAFVLTVGNASNATVLSTTYSGVLGFGGVGTGLTKSGLGTLTLSGANAYTGATIVSLGILKLNNASALGATTGVTISVGGTVDLNGQTTDRNFSSISGTGHAGGGAIINSSGTTATITGTTVLGASSKIGGTGNITVSNAGGLTGSVLLTKFGSGTLTFISTATSARSGLNQIDAGTLRIQAATAIAPIGTGAYVLNSGTLSLGFDVTNAMTNVVNVMSSSTIIADRASAGAGGIVQTLGALGIGGSTLTVKAGDNVTSSTIGLTLGAVTIGGTQLLPGNPTFDAQSTAAAALTLTLGALSDQAIAPRTLTFQNSGAAASTITLGVAAASLIEGTVVNLASTGAALTLNLNIASALGTLAQVTIGTGNTLNLGAAQTIASLSGTGNVTGLFVLTVGNASSASALSTIYSGVLGFGGVGTGLTKSGLGTLTLSGANAYTGATIVSLGILKLDNAAALGATTGVTISAGGTVDLNGQSTTRNFTSVSGTGHAGLGAIINSSSTMATITGTLVQGAVAKIGGSGDIFINNLGGITGNALLTKVGTGTLMFTSTASSARSGTNQIDEGTLRLQAATVLLPVGVGAYALNGGTLSLGFDAGGSLGNAVNVLSSSTIIADRATSGAGGFTFSLGAVITGGSTLTVKAGANVSSGTIGLTLGTITIGGPALAPGDPVFDVQSTASALMTLTLGALTDQAIAPRTITFQNSGTAASNVILATAATSLVDGTMVNLASTGGAVTVNANITNALGTFAQVTVGSGNTFALGASQTIASLNGAGTVSATANATLTIGNVLSPTVSNSIFDGALVGSTLSVVKSGQGSLTLGGSVSNTYSGSGGTLINSGTLILAKTGGAVAIPTNLTLGSLNGSSGTAVLQLDASEQIASTATLSINAGSSVNLNGNNQTLGNLNGNPTSTILNNATGTSSTLTVGSGDATGGQFMGTIADNSSGTGTVALTKTGAGTALLGGYNSYSGATLVEGGTLQAGSGGVGTTGVGEVTVQDTATLIGTGIVQGSSFTAASGSTIQAGDGTAQGSYGTLTFQPAAGAGALDFQAGSTIVLGINPGGTSDLLNIAGTGSTTLLFNGSLTVTASAFTPTAAETFNLLDWSGLASDPTFASHFTSTGFLIGNGDEAPGLDLPDLSGTTFYWDISNLVVNGTILLVPEPSRFMLLGLSLAMLLFRRRR